MKPKGPPTTTADDIEAQFYEAMQQADIDKLMAVWSDDDDIACVHPGGPRVIGPGAIRATFETIFANGAVDVQAHQVRRIQTLTCAVHHVIERVQVQGDDGQPQAAYVLATNVYMETPLGWRMVAHHASPGSSRELQEISEAPSLLH